MHIQHLYNANTGTCAYSFLLVLQLLVFCSCVTEGLGSLQEYADLYADWLLNGSISASFSAFKKGFDVVVRSSNLADLFTAEEVELLVCGSSVRDHYITMMS